MKRSILIIMMLVPIISIGQLHPIESHEPFWDNDGEFNEKGHLQCFNDIADSLIHFARPKVGEKMPELDLSDCKGCTNEDIPFFDYLMKHQGFDLLVFNGTGEYGDRYSYWSEVVGSATKGSIVTVKDHNGKGSKDFLVLRKVSNEKLSVLHLDEDNVMTRSTLKPNGGRSYYFHKYCWDHHNKYP